MLYSSVTPEAKRIAFREGLASGALQQFPGAFNPLSARLIEEKGFDGVYSPAPSSPMTWACRTSA
jgi:methylisocitrate lyase